MLKRFRRLPSPALVIGSIALILAVGGGSFALAITDKKSDKRIAKRVANKQITKRAPNLSVNHANTANSANDASTVGGLHVVNFHQNGPSPQASAQILSLNGLTLIASCTGGTVTVVAQTSVNDGEISATAHDASSGVDANNFDDTFNVGDNFTLPDPTDTDTLGQLAYTGGNLQTVRLFYNEEDSIGTNDCLFNGYAIG